MSDHDDRNPNNPDSQPPIGTEDASSHLSDDQLNAYLDREASSNEQLVIARHLSTCAACQMRLKELNATSMLLKALPAPVLRRSFQLTPATAARPTSLWNRLGGWLLPAVPALRTATVALLLLFCAVTVRNALTDSSSTGPVSDFAAPAQTTSVVVPTIVEESGRNTAQIESNQVPVATAPINPAAAPNEAEPESATTFDSTVSDTSTTSDEAINAASVSDAQATGNESADDTDAAASEAGLAESAPAQDGEADRVNIGGSNSNTSDAAADSAPTSGASAKSSAAESGGSSSTGSASGDSADSTFAMAAPSSPVSIASPTPTVTATDTPQPTATSTVLETATATQSPTLAPIDTRQQSGRDDGADRFWQTAQYLLGGLFVLLLLLVLAARSVRNQPAK